MSVVPVLEKRTKVMEYFSSLSNRVSTSKKRKHGKHHHLPMNPLGWEVKKYAMN